MSRNEEIRLLLKEILRAVKENKGTKFLTAKEVEDEYGIKRKTILNRSNLPVTHKRYIPSVNLKGESKKYIERKVLDRLFHQKSADWLEKNLSQQFRKHKTP